MTPVQLGERLNYGGRWYARGEVVEMTDRDAEDYIALQMGTLAPRSEPTKQEKQAVAVGAVVTKQQHHQGKHSRR